MSHYIDFRKKFDLGSEDKERDVKSVFHKLVTQLVSTPQEEFYDTLIKKIDDHFDSLTSNTLTQQRKSNKSPLKGKLFELICYRLCQEKAFPFLRVKKVWLFDDFPAELRELFSFKNKDMGIDLIVQTTENRWLAIQCKYIRQPKKSSVSISSPTVRTSTNSNYGNIHSITSSSKKIYLRWAVKWKDLSTFYGWVQRTGPPSEQFDPDHPQPINEDQGKPNKSTPRFDQGKPTWHHPTWYRQVVMTSAKYINRQGRKMDTDVSICQGTLRKIPKDIWLKCVGYSGQKLSSEIKTSPSRPMIKINPTPSSIKPTIKPRPIRTNPRTKIIKSQPDLNTLRQKRLDLFSNY